MSGSQQKTPRTAMTRRAIGLAMLALLVAGSASATPVIGSIVAENARGGLVDELNVNTRYDNGAKVRLKTQGAIEIITQRIEAAPGSSFGWHSHPGENVNVVKQGTLTLYHDEHCTEGMEFGPGTSFATHPSEIHLAHNESATEPLVFFATYFAPQTSPLLPIRVDQPSPGPGCPE